MPLRPVRGHHAEAVQHHLFTKARRDPNASYALCGHQISGAPRHRSGFLTHWLLHAGAAEGNDRRVVVAAGELLERNPVELIILQ